MSMYENQPAPDCGATIQSQGYKDRILEELRELQALSETIHSRVFDISGQCVETSCGSGDEKVAREPQNFCEHSLRELKRTRMVLHDIIQHLDNL